MFGSKVYKFVLENFVSRIQHLLTSYLWSWKFSKQINSVYLAFLECLQSFTKASLTMWLNLKQKNVNTLGQKWQLINLLQYGHNPQGALKYSMLSKISNLATPPAIRTVSTDCAFWDIWNHGKGSISIILIPVAQWFYHLIFLNLWLGS